MSNSIQQAMAPVFGGTRRLPTHGVRGTDKRGEAFDLRHFDSAAEARDYRDEIRGSGGNAVAYRLAPAQRKASWRDR